MESNGWDQTGIQRSTAELVVWEDSRGEESRRWHRRVPAGHEHHPHGTEQLVAGGRGDQGQPAVSSQYMVWVDGTDINGRLRSGGTSFSVVRAAGDQYDPAVCGSLVVWTDLRSGNADIYGRNLAGGGDFPIAATAGPEAYPDCDGNRVVYMRTDAVTGADIVLYDVATGQTTPVSVEAGNALRPAISGDRVVWQAWPTQPNAVAGLRHLRAQPGDGPTVQRQHGPGASDGARHRRADRGLGGRPKSAVPDVWSRGPRGRSGGLGRIARCLGRSSGRDRRRRSRAGPS